MFVPRHPTVWAMAGSLLLAPGGFAAAQMPMPDAASQTEESRPEKSSIQGDGAQTPAPTQEAPDGHVPYTPPPEEAAQLPPMPVVDNEEARKEADSLTRDFRHEVPVALKVSTARKTAWIALARQQLEQAGYVIDRPQVLVVVDRNPSVQRLCLILALPNDPDWQVIGSTKVSTGTTGRKYYYITPTGVFTNTADRLGYRALGTKNENGIRGNGIKGMRVWDFGWQWAEKGWLPSREKGQIRLEMHATDPVYLEQRLGHTASEGCIRIPASLNVFIDKHGLIDAEYEQWAAVDMRFKALLRPDRKPTAISGVAVVVVDSADYHPDSDKTAALKENAGPSKLAARG